MKTELFDEALELCGAAYEDCPIEGGLLAKLRYIRSRGMGKGTDGEIDAEKLDGLIARVEAEQK